MDSLAKRSDRSFKVDAAGQADQLILVSQAHLEDEILFLFFSQTILHPLLNP